MNISITQPARENNRGRVDLSLPSMQEGKAFKNIGNGIWQCTLDPVKCGKTFKGKKAKLAAKRHLASWEHMDRFAYLPHHLVFKTDIVISVDVPIRTAPCVIGSRM
jgi:hypothetical protein